MKKTLNKIKATITALWVAIVSFFSKVFGQFGQVQPEYQYQPAYWVPEPYIEQSPIELIVKIVKLAQ